MLTNSLVNVNTILTLTLKEHKHFVITQRDPLRKLPFKVKQTINIKFDEQFSYLNTYK